MSKFFSVLVEHRLVTDREIDRQTHAHSIYSSSKRRVVKNVFAQ